MKRSFISVGAIAASLAASAGVVPREVADQRADILINQWTEEGRNRAAQKDSPIDIKGLSAIENEVVILSSTTKCCSSGTCDIRGNHPGDCGDPIYGGGLGC